MNIVFLIIISIFGLTLVFLMCYKILKAIKKHTKIKLAQTAEIEKLINAISKSQNELRALNIFARDQWTSEHYETIISETKTINNNLINTYKAIKFIFE